MYCWFGRGKTLVASEGPSVVKIPLLARLVGLACWSFGLLAGLR